jgi:hypothetical protein
VGSNPATPAAEIAGQRAQCVSCTGPSGFVRVHLRDYRAGVPKMPSMSVAPAWITGRICFG